LIDAIPEIQLTVDHTAVEYGPVHFNSRGVEMWLPQTAELYTEFKGKRIHQRMTYDNYLLFEVDDKESPVAVAGGLIGNSGIRGPSRR
jgi:hypothetical protein